MDQLAIGPYRVGEQPTNIKYSSYSPSTKQRRNLFGYEAAFVLRKPSARATQYDAKISDAARGEVTIAWPSNPFDEAGNWDMEIWVSNGNQQICSDTFSFRVGPTLLVPIIDLSHQDPNTDIDGGTPITSGPDDPNDPNDDIDGGSAASNGSGDVEGGSP